MKKTHKVIDVIYTEEEGNVAFIGSFTECHDFKNQQGFGYQIIPLNRNEIITANQ